MSNQTEIDLDSLYGKDSLPSNAEDALKDFKVFKNLGWLTEADRSEFLRKATEHLVSLTSEDELERLKAAAYAAWAAARAARDAAEDAAYAAREAAEAAVAAGAAWEMEVRLWYRRQLISLTSEDEHE